jgi:hypothetical protein
MVQGTEAGGKRDRREASNSHIVRLVGRVTPYAPSVNDITGLRLPRSHPEAIW